ncbi:transcription initiation factor TFIID subunit 13-like [Rutidosis leptorrhynchoides]|uniref:transcription initiation factor TFIID subunit 13-like n=1 Tax=Rutidosis leptorrhynchoides TaxID=125765 RepID=UPI003A9A4F87
MTSQRPISMDSEGWGDGGDYRSSEKNERDAVHFLEYNRGTNGKKSLFLPLPETLALIEDIVVDYVTDMVHKAQDIGSKRGKLLTEDFLFLIRKDLRKLNRCTELLSMNEELKQARKVIDVEKERLAQVD